MLDFFFTTSQAFLFSMQKGRLYHRDTDGALQRTEDVDLTDLEDENGCVLALDKMCKLYDVERHEPVARSDGTVVLRPRLVEDCIEDLTKKTGPELIVKVDFKKLVEHSPEFMVTIFLFCFSKCDELLENHCVFDAKKALVLQNDSSFFKVCSLNWNKL